MEKSADAVTAFAANLETVSERLNQKGNIAGVLLNDPSAASSIIYPLKDLQTSSQKLDENVGSTSA